MLMLCGVHYFEVIVYFKIVGQKVFGQKVSKNFSTFMYFYISTLFKFHLSYNGMYTNNPMLIFDINISLT